MADVFSTADIGALLSVPTWRIRRLFEDGTLPDPPRVGRQRAIPREMVATIAQALQDRGWLAPAIDREALSS